VAAASGVQNFMRNLGSSFGTAILTTYWERSGAHHHADLVANLNPYSEALRDQLQRLTDLGFGQRQALACIERDIASQAYLMATNDVLLACGVLMIFLLFLVWMARPPFGIARPGH